MREKIMKIYLIKLEDMYLMEKYRRLFLMNDLML